MKLFIFNIIFISIIIPVTVFSQVSADSSSSFKVAGSCGICKQRIEKAAKINGVKKASWDVATQLLSVTYDTSTIIFKAIIDAIVNAGHDTESKKAAVNIYNQLPDCCHYRDKKDGDIDSLSDDHQVKVNSVNGIVLSEDKKGRFNPLINVSIIWLETGRGVTTDNHGSFSIPIEAGESKLVVSYTGYKPDTIKITDKNDLQIILGSNNSLSTVKVTSRNSSMYVTTTSAFRTTNISSKELLKAACCNLSESFETNPSVDVSYSDAVTGAKQIQLLGLSGNYTQLTVESLPGPRGLATPLGLNSIAGPWVESIQLSKGTGSVVNGFESIAGQINVELKKPENSEKLYANGYINSMGKTDLNLNLSQQLGKKWSTGLLLHNDFQYNKTDFNGDDFRDLPTGNLFSAINRWKYDNGSGLMGQFGVKILLDDKTGGVLDFEKKDKFSTNYYGLGINTKRIEAFAKIGFVFPKKKYQSIGLQLSTFKHNQDAYFGNTTYDANQTNFYSNLIYQSIIYSTTHKFRTGLSLSTDNYDEVYKMQDYKRKELVLGSFFEYTYTMNEKFNVVAGIRTDHNSLFGWFATPRLNVRYEPIKRTTIRLSAGRGQRTANILAENSGIMVSSRNLNIISASVGKAYGLDPEVAWNKGISVDQKFKLFKREAMFSIDFFRNDFVNQVIIDMETAGQVKIYNLQGNSYSNSLQIEMSFLPIKRFDVRLAYRFFDVRATYGGLLLRKPLTASTRAFANLSYDISSWKFDFTINLVGSKRIPSTQGNPVSFRLPESSPNYVTMNGQVSKSFGKAKLFELYVGGENLGNFFQKNVIVASSQPFSQYFDASLIWGPLAGRLIYGGFRYAVK